MRTIIALKSHCLYSNIKAVQQNRNLSCIVYYFSWIGIKDMNKINEFATCIHTLLYLKMCSFRHLNKIYYFKAEFLNFLKIAIHCTQPCAIWIYVLKKWGWPSSFRRKRPILSLNCSAFIENLSSLKVSVLMCALILQKNDAQKGCAMQLKEITLTGCLKISPGVKVL